MIDYHIHSDYSADSEQTIDEICNAASNIGIKEIAITDHIDYEYPYEVYDFEFDINKRDIELEKAKDKYPELIIAKGVEFGLTPDTLKDYKNLLENEKFDYIIASTHIVDGIDPYFPEYFEGRTKQQAYVAYFENRLKCLKEYSDYSVIGHLGYPSRFTKAKNKIINHNDYVNLIDEILKSAIENGKSIEINTKGIPETGDSLPSRSIIKRYKELGGEIVTVGSDAHTTSCIGDYIDETYQVLKEIGFEYVASYKNLIPKFIKI